MNAPYRGIQDWQCWQHCQSLLLFFQKPQCPIIVAMGKSSESGWVHDAKEFMQLMRLDDDVLPERASDY